MTAISLLAANSRTNWQKNKASTTEYKTTAHCDQIDILSSRDISSAGLHEFNADVSYVFVIMDCNSYGGRTACTSLAAATVHGRRLCKALIMVQRLAVHNVLFVAGQSYTMLIKVMLPCKHEVDAADVKYPNNNDAASALLLHSKHFRRRPTNSCATQIR
jgi:hypothetical protein